MDASATNGPLAPPSDRRGGRDRRRTTLASLLRGSPYQNRRRGPRRAADRHGYYVDWYEPRLLLVSLGVLLLSCADAALTLVLLDLGAVEVNLLMARLIHVDVALFAAVKVALTAFGVVVLVVHFSFRLFRRVPVGDLLTLFLAGYLVLLAHELAMLSRLMPVGPPLAG
ncbi:MAG: DUF5658 family protein [Gammaproteobacteria bacterium]|jgi:hypothetical protein|nr:DUF5658 family protein [Gammaproteobacteria bacterium]